MSRKSLISDYSFFNIVLGNKSIQYTILMYTTYGFLKIILLIISVVWILNKPVIGFVFKYIESYRPSCT